MKLKLLQKEIIIFSLAVAGILVCITVQTLTLCKINDMTDALTVENITTNVTNSTEKELFQKYAEYKLYECGGKIGIYDAESDTIIDIIDVFVSTLPKSDRIALKKGIEVFSLSELSSIINDFSS